MAKKTTNSRHGKAVPRRAVKPAKGKPYQRNSRAVATVQRTRQENNLTDGQLELVDACIKLQLSPPRRKIPSHQKVLEAMKRDKQNIKKMPNRQQRLIFFLYSRGFLPRIKNNKERSQKIRHLVFSSTSAEHKRLVKVALTSTNGDVMMLHPGRDWHQFGDGKSRQLRKNWSPTFSDHRKKDSYVMTVDVGYEELGDLPELVQRSQASKTGSCFLHAPALLVNYVIQKHTGEFQGQIDISKVVRHAFDRDMFFNFVDGNSGDSFKALYSILGSAAALCSVYPENCQRSFHNLRKYGPGLVSRFAIYTDFRTARKFSYSEIPDYEEEPEGFHAMIAIAMRYDTENDTWWYLLQNTWSRKQFIEVTAEYLAHCAGHPITFVVGKITKLPESFRKCRMHYGEAHLDGGDDVFTGPLEG